MKYSNAALPPVIGSEIPHRGLHRLCALCFREEVASTCELLYVRNAITHGHLSWVFPSYCILISHFAQTLWRGACQKRNLLGLCGKILQSQSGYDVRAYVCLHRCAGGAEQSRRTDRRTGCLWGQGLGGVLAGTTPDSNLVDAPWQFCTFMSLLIKVSTYWAGKTTVPVPPGPPYRKRRGGWEHFLPPVLPCPSNAHWADKSGQLWWPLVGQGRRCQLCQCQRWEQSYIAHSDLGENETWKALFLLCNSQGQRERDGYMCLTG